jgi:hypothetical protein
VVNEAEAKQVRQIRIYLRHGALIPAVAEINRRGSRMKSWTAEKGRAHIGQQFDRPALVRVTECPDTGARLTEKVRLKKELDKL